MSARLAFVCVVCAATLVQAGGGRSGNDWVASTEKPANLPLETVVANLRKSSVDRDVRTLAWKYGFQIRDGGPDAFGWDPSRSIELPFSIVGKDRKASDESLAQLRALQPQTLKASLDEVLLFVGNERGHTLQTITLRDYLTDLRRYLHDPARWTGGTRSLLTEKETEVEVTTAAVWVPATAEGSVEFVGSTPWRWGSATLEILATRVGTSTSQRLPGFNKAGRTQAFSVSPINRNARSGESQDAAGSSLHVLLWIQVPIKSRFGSGAYNSFGGFGGGGGFFDIPAAVPTPPAAPFEEIDGSIERDP